MSWPVCWGLSDHWPHFVRIVGPADRTFDLTDVGKISGLGTANADYYVRQGVLYPSVRPGSGAGRGRTRLFSWRDAFVAGVIGSLRRQNVPLEMLRRVAELLRQPTTQPLPTTNDEKVEAGA